MTRCSIKFGTYNALRTGYLTWETSGDQTNYGKENLVDDVRKTYWRPETYYVIDSSNNRFHYDGTYASVASGEYTASTLATAIQTALGAGWTVTYNSSDKNFRASRTTSWTANLSTSTNAIWQTINFSGPDQLLAPSQILAGGVSVHWPYVFHKVDFGYSAEVSLVAAYVGNDEEMTISSSAVITLEANSIDDFSSPPYSRTIERFNDCFLSADTDLPSYRFVRLKISDPYNPDDIKIGELYVGGVQELDARNVSTGFGVSRQSLTASSQARDGALYFDREQSYRTFDRLRFLFLGKENKELIEGISEQFDISRPLIIVIDPLEKASTDISKLSSIVFLKEPIQFTHAIGEFWNCELSAREII